MQRRAVVTHLLQRFPVSSERRACRLVRLSRSRWQSRMRRSRHDELRARLKELALLRPRWGYQRLHVLMRREGYRVNHKLVLRLYREEGLAVRRRSRKRVAVPRVPLPAPTAANARWSMDFVSDALADGRAFRCLTIVDDCTRECPAIEAAHSLPALRVIQVLDRLAATRGLPGSIVCDNGPEFAGKALDLWAHRRDVALQFITPGKPVENAYIESFNGRFRDECLNSEWFTSLTDAQRVIERWRRDYNEARPHSGLAGRTPEAFARELQQHQQLTPSPQRLTAWLAPLWGGRHCPFHSHSLTRSAPNSARRLSRSSCLRRSVAGRGLVPAWTIANWISPLSHLPHKRPFEPMKHSFQASCRSAPCGV